MTRADALLLSFDTILSDLDGVVYAGAGAIAGAPEALTECVKRGLQVAFITNNASRSPEKVAEHLQELGAPATTDNVFGSADAGVRLLLDVVTERGLTPDGIGTVLVAGSTYLEQQVQAAGFTALRAKDADGHGTYGAVIQGFDPSLTWSDLANSSYAINRGAIWVATNTDYTIPRAEGIAPGNGSLVNAVAMATNQYPVVAGKPAPVMFEQASQQLGSKQPVVVGDRLDTDIRGGNAASIPTILVLTGIDTVETALGAVTAERPTFMVKTLDSLFEPYETPELSSENGGNSWTCGPWTAQFDASSDTIAMTSNSDNSDDSDVRAWRAACAAYWHAVPEQEEQHVPHVSFPNK